MQGDTKGSGQYLDRMNALLNSERHLEYSLYHNQRGWQALLNRDLPMAMEHTLEAKRLARETGIVGAHAFNHQALCLIHLETGEYEQAQHHLTRAREIGRGKRSGMLQFFSHLLLARVWLERGRNTQALSELRLAMEMGRQHGYRTTPWWHAPSMAQLCMQALDAGIEVEYVQGLVRQRKLVPHEPPLDIENWPWPIKIFTLGGFSMLINDTPYQPAGKAQQKPMELLKLIIAFGGRSVSQDALADILWPDVEGDKAHQAFATTLFRLRKLLGPTEAIQLREKKLSLNDRYCWLDVWALDHLLIKTETAIAAEKSSRRLITRLSQKLLDLYQGHFLADETGASWPLSYRERLRSRLLHQLSQLAQYWERLEIWETATDIYLRALEVDALMEESYQHLMICYQKQGRQAEALAVFERCQQTLRSQLLIEPGEKTHKLHAQILHGRKLHSRKQAVKN